MVIQEPKIGLLRNCCRVVCITHMRIVAIVVVVLLCDQLTKFWVLQYLAQQGVRVYRVASFFNIVLMRNYGVSFGFLNVYRLSPYYFMLMSCLVVAVVYWWYWYSVRKCGSSVCSLLSTALITGGAIGNVIDRFISGAVLDFLDFHICEYHYPAFNVADMAIVIGAGMTVLNDFLLVKAGHSVRHS